MTAKKSMAHCYSKVKTQTGVFTFHDEKAYECKAKQICAAKGEILAPLTKQEDREKLRAGLKLDNGKCFQHLLGKNFHHGIDVEICDGKPIWYTSAGEKVDNIDEYFNYMSLGEITKFADVEFIPVSIFEDGTSMFANEVARKVHSEKSFICMKPASTDTAAEPLYGDSPFPVSFIVICCLACCFAISTVGFAVAYFREKRHVKTDDCSKLEEC